MFSSDSARQADACRFCWMCRHICPVGGATGNEAWTPRARGLMISMIERGTPFDADIADMMYKCSMCDACANDCATGYKPTDFIREARIEAIVQGLAPDKVLESIENIEKKKNIYGIEESGEVLSALEELPDAADTVLYLGQMGRTKGKDAALAIISLLKKSGVDFTVLKEEPGSGAFLSELMGFTGEVQQKAKELSEVLKEKGCKKLVAFSPHDACILKQEYAEWGLIKDIEVVTATTYLADLIKAEKLSPKKIEMRASLHDPCRLTRGLEESQPVRDIIQALGIELTELFLNRKMSRCCGGPVLDSYAPEVTAEMAAVRIDDAVRIDVDAIITACPDGQMILSDYNRTETKIIDLFVLLNENC